MSTLTFDTLRYAERLRAGGVQPEHAVAHAEGLQGVLSEALDSQLATKLDVLMLGRDMSDVRSELKAEIHDVRTEIQGVRVDLKGEIHGVRTELKAEIQEMRTEVKAEIQELRTEVKTEIQELRTEAKAEFQDVKSDVLRLDAKMEARFALVDGKFDKMTWMISAVIALAAANFARQFF